MAISGDIMRMPGLPKRPAAVNMDIDEDGKISLILTVNPVGRPSKEAWSDNEYCVLATQIGNWLNPCSVYFLILFFAFFVNSTPSPP